ncbi:MAG: hypothetical protein Q9M89_08490 [Persephonella sp.]|nr:hypothetical protein [Persephonella sp.]
MLGGGFGGTEAAISLAKEGFDVELVSDRDYLFVLPYIHMDTYRRSKT